MCSYNLIVLQSLGFPLAPVKGDKGRAYIMYLQGSACNSGLNYSSKFEFECDPKSGQVRECEHVGMLSDNDTSESVVHVKPHTSC
jgi:hypothetical protein